MKKMKIKLIVITGLLIPLLSLCMVVDAYDWEKDIKATTQMLEEEKKAHQKEFEQAAAAHQSLKERIEVLQKNINSISEEISIFEKDIILKKDKRARLKIKKEKIDNSLKSIKVYLSKYIKEIENTVTNGFPYDKETRLKKTASLKNRLVSKDEDLFDVLHEIYVFLLGEITLAETSELYSDDVELANGDIKKAKFVRVGRNMLFYRTNDERDFGFLENSRNGYAWDRSLSGKEKKNIKKAVRIMEGKEIPRHLAFPMIFSGRVE